MESVSGRFCQTKHVSIGHVLACFMKLPCTDHLFTAINSSELPTIKRPISVPLFVPSGRLLQQILHLHHGNAVNFIRNIPAVKLQNTHRIKQTVEPPEPTRQLKPCRDSRSRLVRVSPHIGWTLDGKEMLGNGTNF